MDTDSPPWSPPAKVVSLHTSKTIDVPGEEDARVSARKDPVWPEREAFLGWLDDVKRRLSLGSDNQLAQYFSIGHTLISNWRNGRQRPSMETLTQIARSVGEDPRRLWILGGIAEAADVGLDERDLILASPALPIEVEQLLGVLADARLSEQDRADVLRHVRLITVGVLADLAERDRERDRKAS